MKIIFTCFITRSSPIYRPVQGNAIICCHILKLLRIMETKQNLTPNVSYFFILFLVESQLYSMAVIYLLEKTKEKKKHGRLYMRRYIAWTYSRCTYTKLTIKHIERERYYFHTKSTNVPLFRFWKLFFIGIKLILYMQCSHT